MIWAVITLTYSEDTTNFFVSGVFDSIELAEDAVEQLTLQTKEKKLAQEYYVIEYTINELYEDIQLSRPVDEEIADLCKEGLIDYKVGEDGEFYFHLTEEGKKFTKAELEDRDDND